MIFKCPLRSCLVRALEVKKGEQHVYCTTTFFLYYYGLHVLPLLINRPVEDLRGNNLSTPRPEVSFACTLHPIG